MRKRGQQTHESGDSLLPAHPGAAPRGAHLWQFSSSMLVRPVTALLSCLHTVFMSPDSSARLMRATDDSISTATESSGCVRLCWTQGRGRREESRSGAGKSGSAENHEAPQPPLPGVVNALPPRRTPTRTDGPTAHLGALLLQRGQLLLVQVGGEGVHLRQLRFGVHQLQHGLLGHALLDGSVDGRHGCQPWRGTGSGARLAERRAHTVSHTPAARAASCEGESPVCVPQRNETV